MRDETKWRSRGDVDESFGSDKPSFLFLGERWETDEVRTYFFHRRDAEAQRGKKGKKAKSENAEGAEVTLITPDPGEGLEFVSSFLFLGRTLGDRRSPYILFSPPRR